LCRLGEVLVSRTLVKLFVYTCWKDIVCPCTPTTLWRHSFSVPFSRFPTTSRVSSQHALTWNNVTWPQQMKFFGLFTLCSL
jgi:hypothetical protein